MKHLNYLMVITALLMMNVMNAELKTFGMPSNTEEAPAEEAPAEEAPAEEAPAEEAPAEEAPAEEAPTEEDPSEETPMEEDEMPSASEDGEVSTDQPIKFKEEFLVKINLGASLFKGKNLSPFTSDIGFGFNLATPFGFKLGNSEYKLVANLGMLNNPIEEADNEANGWEYTDYNLTNFGLGLSTNFSAFGLGLGAGMSSSDYGTFPYMSGALSYTLPISSLLEKIPSVGEQLQVSMDASGIYITGGPDDNGDSSVFLNFGVSVGYPIFF